MTEKRKSQVAPSTVWSVCLHVTLFAILAAFLWFVREALLIILLALFVTVVLNPIVRWLEHHHIRRVVGAILVGIAAVALIALILILIAPMIVSQVQNLVNNLPDFFERLKGTAFYQNIEGRYHFVSRLRDLLEQQGPSIAASALILLKDIVWVIFGLVSAFALAIFMLIFGPALLERMLSQVKPATRARFILLGERMERTVGGYILGTIIIALIGGIIMTLATLFVGVQYFLALGLIMFLLGLLPFMGPFLAAVIIIGTTLGSKGLTAGIIVTAVYLAYHFTEGHLLQPLVQRKTIKMDPLIILIALLIGTMAGGIIGALFALPIAGAVQVIILDTLEQHSKEKGTRE